MFRTESFTFTSRDSMEIFVYKWFDDSIDEPIGILQIIHGSIEHAKRYEAFAKVMAEKGYVVYANDHRGHGKTAKTEEDLSYFSDEEDGWDLAVEDIHHLTKIAKQSYPEKPIFLLGHSMGSFLLRDYGALYGEEINGMILSGTGCNNPLLNKLAIFLSKREMKKNGRKSRNKKLHELVYESLNKRLPEQETSCDFISRDKKVREAYLNDPLCGYRCTAEYIFHMISGMDKIEKNECYDGTPNSLPIYLMSGEKDPVGYKDGAGVRKVGNRYIKHGSKDVKVRLYKDAYHEMLNELNKEEVYEDIFNWMTEKTS